MGIQIQLPRPSPTGDGGLAHITKVISKIPVFLQLVYFGGICIPLMDSWGFPGGSVIKDPPAMQETQVQSLVWEDPLEKEMATHSSILAWEIPWTEDSGGLQSMRSQKTLLGLSNYNNNKNVFLDLCHRIF